MRRDIAQVLFDDDAGAHELVIADRGDDSLQCSHVDGDPLANAGDAGGQLDAHLATIEQRPAGAQRVLPGEGTVPVQHGVRDAPRKFVGPADRGRGPVGHQRMGDRLRCDERKGDHAAEQILGAVDAQSGGVATGQRGARHEVGRGRIARARIVLARVLESRQADQAPGDLRPRRRLVTVWQRGTTDGVGDDDTTSVRLRAVQPRVVGVTIDKDVRKHASSPEGHGADCKGMPVPTDP